MQKSAQQILAPVAGVTAIVYLALVMAAAGCLFLHAAPSGGHDHHGADFTHSPLCAWSCQAISGGAIASSPPPVTAWAIEQMIMSAPFLVTSVQVAALLQPRAPPLPVLS